jgi:hypothetical protein
MLQSASQSSSQSASQSAAQSAVQSAVQPAAQPASQSASQPAGLIAAPVGPSYQAFMDAESNFKQDKKTISLQIVRDAIIEALGLDSAIIFNSAKPSEESKSDNFIFDQKTNEYDEEFIYENLQHRNIIRQVSFLLKQDFKLNNAINIMVAPGNKNLQEETKTKLKTLKTNLGILQGLVLREKLKRLQAPSRDSLQALVPNDVPSILDINPLLDALNDKVKTLNSILAVQKTGNLNYQLGGSSTKLNDLSNYVKYKMKYLTLKNRK